MGTTSLGLQATVDSFQAFERDLRESLAQLHNPAFQPSELVCAVVGCDTMAGPRSARGAILAGIADLTPASRDPSLRGDWRVYEILSSRYEHQLTQEDTAERLGISPRHLQREQRAAIHILARHLWRRSGRQPPGQDPAREGADREYAAAEVGEPSWRQQVRQELAVLQDSGRSSVAEVAQVIAAAAELARGLAARHEVTLILPPVDPSLAAAVHPTSLRQVLLSSITELTRRIAPGQVSIATVREGRRVRITLTGRPARIDEPLRDSLMEELLAMQGGRFWLAHGGGEVSICLDLPPVGKTTVLVVDDNPDVLYTYRRYALGTDLQIVTVSQDQWAPEAVHSLAPDAIVLDVMLPNLDGWEILAALHEHPATRPIPIVVCSVVREEELALSLGATAYIAKPVGRAQFVETLRQALNLAASGPMTGSVNNVAAC